MFILNPGNRTTDLRWRSWWFSGLLLLAYLAAFHAWNRTHIPEHWIKVSAVALATILFASLWLAGRTGCFVNGWDRAFHGAVILDLLIEGLWVEHSGNFGFYACAAGFIVVIGGYRILVRVKRGSEKEKGMEGM